MSKTWLAVLTLLWSLSAIFLWPGVLDEIQNCRSRKHLYKLIATGLIWTILGPIGWLSAVIMYGVLQIVEKYKELKDEDK